MGLLDRLVASAGDSVLSELKGIRAAIEVCADSYRQANGMQPVFDTAARLVADQLQAEAAATVVDSSGAKILPGSAIRPGDFQLLYMLEELARENNVPLTTETDLEQLGLDRGWISPDGQMLVWPASMAGAEIEVRNQGWRR